MRLARSGTGQRPPPPSFVEWFAAGPTGLAESASKDLPGLNPAGHRNTIIALFKFGADERIMDLTVTTAGIVMLTTGLNRCLAAVLILVTVTSAAAEVDDVIADCARIRSTGDRILCLEEALRRLDSDSDAPVSGEAPVDANATGVVSEVPAPQPQGAAETVMSAAPDPSSEQAAGVPADGADSFGLPPEQSQPERPETMLVTVTSVRQNAYGKLVFSTERGQEWIQTDQASRRFRDIPFDAEIRAAASGSFFLRRASGGPSIRVRRRK